MQEAEQRSRVVSIAREWIGTRYRHQGRIKGVAADCTFLAKVYEEAGMCGDLNIQPYSPSAHLHRAGGTYLQVVQRFMHETDEPKAGDMVLYFIGRDFSHGAMIGEQGWPQIIHADLNAGFVLEAVGDQGNLADAKERKFMTPW